MIAIISDLFLELGMWDLDVIPLTSPGRRLETGPAVYMPILLTSLSSSASVCKVTDTNNCRGVYDLPIKLYQIVWYRCNTNDVSKFWPLVIAFGFVSKASGSVLEKGCPKIQWLIMIFPMKTSINLGTIPFFWDDPVSDCWLYKISNSILCIDTYMCVYVYILYVYTHIYIYTLYTYIYIYAYIHIYIHMLYVCVYIYVQFYYKCPYELSYPLGGPWVVLHSPHRSLRLVAVSMPWIWSCRCAGSQWNIPKSKGFSDFASNRNCETSCNSSNLKACIWALFWSFGTSLTSPHVWTKHDVSPYGETSIPWDFSEIHWRTRRRMWD